MINKYLKWGLAALVSAEVLVGTFYLGRVTNRAKIPDKTPANTFESKPEGKLEETPEKVYSETTPKKPETPNVPETLETKINDYSFDLPGGRIYKIISDNGNVCEILEELDSRNVRYRFIETTGNITKITTLEKGSTYRAFELPEGGVFDLYKINKGVSRYKRTIDGRNQKIKIIDILDNQGEENQELFILKPHPYESDRVILTPYKTTHNND